jgi:putative PIN family toxin of toxin-antitoxin system
MRPPRAVADPNVLIAAAIAPRGVCAQLLHAAVDGRWQPVVSPQLLDELREVLARTKFRRWLSLDEASQFVRNVRDLAEELPDPPPPATRRSADPDDEYLLALAAAAHVTALISGDRHLTELPDLDPPVLAPAAFLASLTTNDR